MRNAVIIFVIVAIQFCEIGSDHSFALRNRRVKGNRQLLFLSDLSLFRRTSTKTVIRTVATVWTASFRTCTTSAQNIMPCARNLRLNLQTPEASVPVTPSIVIIFGDKTISNQTEVIDYLEHDKKTNTSANNTQHHSTSSLEKNDNLTTLYPSTQLEEDDILTTETSWSEQLTEKEILSKIDQGRVGLGLTTITSTISITKVSTSVNTRSTLTVAYSGCIPNQLPVTTMAC